MKSPLTAKPLRNPGHSLDGQILDLVWDHLMFPMMAVLMLGLNAGLEWWRWYFNVPPKPWLMTIFALVGLAYFGWKLFHSRKRIKNLVLGRDGERAVGQFLEGLREKGAKVFHDFPGDGFNIDHVVVHSSGVYAIETKTFSKPDKGDARVVFNGEGVEIFGKTPDRNPVVQARANAKWLKDLVKESAGKNVVVRPVVVFPGWYVEVTAEAKASDVWVLNPRALPSFIDNSRQQLAAPDVQLVSFHLSRYVRSV